MTITPYNAIENHYNCALRTLNGITSVHSTNDRYKIYILKSFLSLFKKASDEIIEARRLAEDSLEDHTVTCLTQEPQASEEQVPCYVFVPEKYNPPVGSGTSFRNKFRNNLARSKLHVPSKIVVIDKRTEIDYLKTLSGKIEDTSKVMSNIINIFLGLIKANKAASGKFLAMSTLCLDIMERLLAMYFGQVDIQIQNAKRNAMKLRTLINIKYAYNNLSTIKDSISNKIPLRNEMFEDVLHYIRIAQANIKSFQPNQNEENIIQKDLQIKNLRMLENVIRNLGKRRKKYFKFEEKNDPFEFKTPREEL